MQLLVVIVLVEGYIYVAVAHSCKQEDHEQFCSLYIFNEWLDI